MKHINRLRSRLHLLAALTLVVTVSGCVESRSTPMEPTRPATFIGDGFYLVPLLTTTAQTLLSQVIGPAGGVLQISGGHSITFPAGALPANTTITAVRDGGDLKISLGPEGLVFPDSAQPILSFDYDGSAAEGSGSPVIVYLDSNGWLSEVLPTSTDTTANVARARIAHFSTYALATD
jgi:hypothetical protein